MPAVSPLSRHCKKERARLKLYQAVGRWIIKGKVTLVGTYDICAIMNVSLHMFIIYTGYDHEILCLPSEMSELHFLTHNII